MVSTLAVIVQNLGNKINSKDLEYSAVISYDQRGIYFTSRRQDKANRSVDGLAYENIYGSYMDTDDQWIAATIVNNLLDSDGNNAPIQMYAGDKKLIIYHDENLYLAEFVDGNWSGSRSLEMINQNSSFESHCFINVTEDTIFFSSDRKRPGSDLDIYMVYKKAQEDWTSPQPLQALNTDHDEDSPFLASDGTLYFSSRGHSSLGGEDIFKTSYSSENQSWEKPQNMWHPINSVYDDSYFIRYGRVGYFSSARLGVFGSMDLYRVLFFDKIKLPVTVINTTDGSAVTGATLDVIHENISSMDTDTRGKCDLVIPVEQEFVLRVIKDHRLVYLGKYLLKVIPNKGGNQFQLKVHISPDDRISPTR